jgi:2-oxoglutarate/2-oxoacid ferredoxin oxidoreductase subunit beta
MSTTLQDYRRKQIRPVWCPGCGNYGVLKGVERAFAGLRVPPEQIVVVSGIGCSGRFSHYLNTYSLHGTHGRALPIATGVKTARPDLTVLVVGGDGDSLGIGGGHLPHAARKNVDLTFLILDNNTYGLTKGQSSPTTPWGCITKTAPYGSPEDSLDVLPILLAYGISFVARASSLQTEEMAGVILEALQHPGFAVVHILSPCITYPVLAWKTLRQRLAPLPADHSPADKLAALQLAYSNDPIYTGVFYNVRKPTLDARLRKLHDGALKSYSSRGREPGIPSLMERFL